MSSSRDNTSDLDLVRRVLRGEAEALDRFIARMRCVGAILAARNTRSARPLDRHDLADLVQDTLVVVWRKLDTYAGEGPLEAWVYRISSYELMNTLREKGRLPRPAGDLHQDDALHSETEKVEQNTVSSGEMKGYLKHLADREAEVVRMKHFDQLTFEEIARLLEVTPSTVKTHYYRGVDKLRSILEPRLKELRA